jgi:hypothetical protein
MNFRGWRKAAPAKGLQSFSMEIFLRKVNAFMQPDWSKNATGFLYSGFDFPACFTGFCCVAKLLIDDLAPQQKI